MGTAGYAVWTELAYYSSRPRRLKFLCLIKHHAEDGWRLYILHYEFLISALGGGLRLASRPPHFTPGERTRPHPTPQRVLTVGSVGLQSKCGHNGEYQPLA
jgi:hypothetical protein